MPIHRNTSRITILLILLATLATKKIQAQWDIEDSHTTASLRGIDNVGNGVAWASGTNGTVLRTEDGGYVWQLCAIPPGAEKLDFRGIQAFDDNTAIVMSSGKGDLSRLYKTTDGCQTWKLLFTNPDKEGFWDAIQFSLRSSNTGHSSEILLGDPVDGSLRYLCNRSTVANTWNVERRNIELRLAGEGQSQGDSFAASNQRFVSRDSNELIGIRLPEALGWPDGAHRLKRFEEVVSFDCAIWLQSCRPGHIQASASIGVHFARCLRPRNGSKLQITSA